MLARRGRESRASRGVGASNLRCSEDPVELSALPLLAPAPALRGGSPAHDARAKRALPSPRGCAPRRVLVLPALAADSAATP